MRGRRGIGASEGIALKPGAEPGGSLLEIVAAQGPLPADLVRRLGADVARRLARLHATRQVHGGMSPAAIRITPESADLVSATPVFDNPGYLSPEVAEGKPAGPAADVYGLGAALVYAATGAGPFGAGSPIEVLHRIIEIEPDLRRVPEPLREVVLECLRKNPDDRPLAAQLVVRLDPPIPQTVRMTVAEPAAAQQQPAPSEAVTERHRIQMPSGAEPQRSPTRWEATTEPNATTVPSPAPANPQAPQGNPHAATDRDARPLPGPATPHQGFPAVAGIQQPPPRRPAAPPTLSPKARRLLPFLVAGATVMVALTVIAAVLAFVLRDSNPQTAATSGLTTSVAPGPPRIYAGEVGGLAAATDSRHLFVSNRKDRTVSIIDTETNKMSASIPVPGIPYGLAASADGKFVYTVTDIAVAAISTTTNSVVRQSAREVRGPADSVALTPDGRRLYVANGVNPTVTVYDTQAMAPLTTIPFSAGQLYGVKLVVMAPDGKHAYVGDPHGISVVDTAADTVVTQIPREAQPVRMAVSPDSKYLYLPKPSGGIDVIDAATGGVAGTVNLTLSNVNIAVSPSGRYIFVAGKKDPTSSVLAVVDAASRQVVDTLDVSTGFEPAIAVSPNGQRVYLGATLGGNDVTVLDVSRYA
ncbi:hypothetical protein F5544_19235 [Nocardia arthritidis]|uniref:Protein kinase domain-containing protein n=1 Tax=Nocardia arthritidis TaxID=228602 RepID=A0A6G9YEK5_9NOCA|nr:hypothetical protein F5544_19235 [Nocardia arthritidis]